MPSSNLTRADAEARSASISVHSYEVSLDLRNARDLSSKTFTSRTTVHFGAEPGAGTFIDLAADSLNSVTLNDQSVDVSGYDGKKIILSGLADENTLVVDAQCLYMNTGEGMHRFQDPADGETYLYTQFEARDASRVYASFDQPDMKARFQFNVAAPEGWTVFSNTTGTSAPHASGDGVQWEFDQTLVIPTYVTAVISGPYVGVQDVHDGIPLGVYARKSMREFLEAEEVLTITKQGFDFFHREFDFRYPFGKYDQIFVPEFNAGAMENAACVTISDDYALFRGRQTRLRYESRAETILHEMAHMWFGDLVTMRWWDDIWLNESFAEWAGHWATANATKYGEAWTSFCTIRKGWGMRADQLSSTHPVATDAPDVLTAEVNFDGITYAKGASLLKQLVAYVGLDPFMNGLRSYFKTHAYGNATLDDLLHALSEASGRDMTTWAEKWIQTAGINTLKPVITASETDLYASVSVEQSATAEHPTLRPHRLHVGLFDRNSDGELVRRDQLEIDIDGPTTPIAALQGIHQPDLLLLNDGDHTYAKIRLDEKSARTVVESLYNLNDPLSRAIVWFAAWDAVRDGEMRTKDYIQTVTTSLSREHVIGLVQGHIIHAAQALDKFADPAWRPEGRKAFADAAWAAATEAQPGSDVQLVWVRAFALAAREPEHVARVADLLAGREVLESLALDPVLRWHLVQQLAITGAIGDAEIAAELERDNTDVGAREAATAYAAIPTAEAKARAWAQVLDETIPHQTALAVMRGFISVESSPSSDASLLEQYVEKYFALVPEVWEHRTSEAAAVITEILYPGWVVSEEMVERSNAYLAERTDLPDAARRFVAEGRDGVVRALKARKCDVEGLSVFALR